ncbi:MAG: hypothetical protein JTJ21_11055 [Holdemanella sp.]|nr:hypothetical protein [Holdemanella sp.]
MEANLKMWVEDNSILIQEFMGVLKKQEEYENTKKKKLSFEEILKSNGVIDSPLRNYLLSLSDVDVSYLECIFYLGRDYEKESDNENIYEEFRNICADMPVYNKEVSVSEIRSKNIVTLIKNYTKAFQMLNVI